MKTRFCLFAALILAAMTISAQPTGSKGGRFTVASGRQVRFSQGNLQFNVSQGSHQTADGTQPGTWRFAEHQYDTIGKSNTNIIVENYTGWISLFGWGTSGYNGKSPMMYVRDNAQYGDGTNDIAGTNYDWGVYNAISNGGDWPGLWRTPTREEYSYMLKNRANAEQLWSKGTVNGITGFIFLPDDWTLPTGITFTPKARYDENVYSIEQWTQLENNGAIFIPREGYQNYSTSNLRMEYSTGNHYLATGSCKSTSQRYVLSGGQTDPSGSSCSTFRYTGVPVRLVRTVEEYTVTFKDWDGTTLKTENIEYGFAANPPSNPTREGYTFVSWQSNVSGMQTNYITGEVTFTAQYEKYITYTVTFVDGATNEIIKTETVKKGENATAPTVPSHLGWTFTGWDKSFTNVQSDLVVTAQYTWDETDGRLNGKFSVAAGKQVYFAKGNLLYQPANNRWRFAGYQYDWKGVDANTHVGESDYDGWIDLFGWSNTANNFGVTAGWEENEFSGVFVDWGDNPIENGGNKQYAWYTLTSAEWDYLFNTRTDAASKYSFATVNGLRGMIILPDSWTKPSGISFTAKATSYDTNTYSANQWELLEANGAVFLPQTGERERTTVQSYGSTGIGMYRVGNPGGTRQDANVLLWMKSGNSYYIDAASGQAEYKGYSVRLARPVQICSKTSSFTASAIGSYVWEGRVYTTSGAFTRNFRTAQGCDSVVTMVLTITQEQPAEGTGLLSGLFSVSADRQAQFSQGNLQYQPLTNSWRFATNQYDLIGPDNNHITEAAYGGWIDLFAWSCTGNNDYGIMRNLDSYTFSGDFAEWGNNAVLNGGNRPHFWQTLSEEEWDYILTERSNADNLWSYATVNSINGMILLPDNWTTPAGLTFVPSSKYYASNIFTPAQWAQMESAGAVFLPATGGYSIWPTLYVGGWNLEGAYFSADKNQSEGGVAMVVTFYGSGDYASEPYIRDLSFGSVRLVRMGECVAKTTSITEARCDSYVWDGTTYTESGDYQKSYVTLNGCDSIVTLHLTINKSYETGFGEQAEISYTWQGTTYTESGDYTKTLQSVAGCDSIVTLHLTIGSDDPEVPVQKWANGVLPGKFSVSADKQVNFSQGNLQYQASTETWQFAENQNDYIGDANANISPTYDGWIDLFGWGTGDSPTKSSGDYTDYTTFTDWGVNAISNGGNAANLWRTLSADEWFYLLKDRPNAPSLLALGSINNELGIIVLPDDWVAPSGATVATMSINDWKEANDGNYYVDDQYSHTRNKNKFTSSQWAVLEEAGAVFLPFPGRRRYDETEGVITDYAGFGFYWSSTRSSERYAFDMSGSFNTINPRQTSMALIYIGHAVRLVQDVPPQKWKNGALPGKFSVSADKQVNFSQGNLQYKASDNIWQFAQQQTDYVGADNANIAPDYDGWIDLFGWGTGNNPTNTSEDYNDYPTFTDWGINPISNGGNTANMWHTLSHDELVYLFHKRANAGILFGLGTVDGLEGMIILPDNWVLPEEASFTASTTMGLVDTTSYGAPLYENINSGTSPNFSHNTYTATQWEVMESAGAVFLPVTYYRKGTHAWSSTQGGYWSSTWYTSGNGHQLKFNNRYVQTEGGPFRYYGYPVRLVKEAEETCESITNNIAMQSCDLYRWNGVEYTESGNYTQTLQRANGCDSIVNMALTITPSYPDVRDTVTAESSYIWEGDTIYQSGDYTKWLYTATYYCDSVVTLHLTITNPLPIGDQTWRADDEDIKILGTIATNITIRNLTFVATEAKTIAVEGSNKSYNDLSFTYVIKMGGSMAENARHLKFNVNPGCTIEIYGMSANSSNTRTLNICSGTYNNVIQTYDLTGDAINYVKYEYSGPATTILLGSANSGINIYAINVTYPSQGLENTKSTIESEKILIDGQVYILRNGRIYTILGAEVR
jgi:hypothetical protein